MIYRASFCDPFQADIVELGSIAEEQIIDLFNQIPWSDLLCQMESKSQSEVHYSPSLEIENNKTQNGLSISVTGESDSYEFYVFYQRPKRVKRFFGLFSEYDKKYTTEVMHKTKQEVLQFLDALIAGKYDYLEEKIR